MLVGIAIYYQAGQQLSGRFAVLFGGNRNILSLNQVPSSLPRVSLKIAPEEEKAYADVLKVIETQSEPSDSIFAVPSNPELYFLSGRRNPFRFFNTALGIRNESDFQKVRELLIADPPKLVIFRADDKYNTNYSLEIVALIRDRYDFVGDTAGFAIYRSRRN